jgi:SAM-dependent methyltransferase
MKENEFDFDVVECCPICGSFEPRPLLKKYDDRFGQPDLFEYYYCQYCDIAFLKNKIQEASLADLYRKYYGKNNQPGVASNKLKSILEKLGMEKMIFQWLAGNIFLLNTVRKGSKVLEIGSGHSPELKKVIALRKLDWTGLEVDDDLVARLKRDSLQAVHGTIKLNSIQETFDYVVSSQSLEHQYDVNDFFEKSRGVLKSGGKVIFTTPNFDSRYRKKYGEKWINWHAPYHITILSKKGVENLCKKHGFVISKFFTYTPTSWYMLQSVFTIPKRGEVNAKFNFNFSLMKQLFVSIFLRIYECFNKKTGDCIYCEVRLKS